VGWHDEQTVLKNETTAGNALKTANAVRNWLMGIGFFTPGKHREFSQNDGPQGRIFFQGTDCHKIFKLF
jgi:hypothetical protein